MNSLCRLCATYTEPNELVTNLIELESKLMLCCGWKPSLMEMHMPKNVCNFCVDELLRSWNLVERIRAAETKLNKILSENTITNQFDEHQNLKIEVDIDAEQVDSFGEIEVKYVDNVKDDDEVDFDVPFDNNDDDNDDINVYGEPVNYLRTKKRNRASRSNKNNNEQKNDPFLSKLTTEDFLDDGTISCNGIEKLTKLFPDMKKMSWNDCQYKCTQCNRILKGAQVLYAHVRSIHVDELMSMKISCFYCKFKHRREYILNQHVATEHFAHLKFL